MVHPIESGLTVLSFVNTRASGVTDKVAASVLASLDGFAQRPPIVFANGTGLHAVDRHVRCEYAFASRREGYTVVLIVGGDGSVQRLRQLAYEMGDAGGKLVFMHVARGLVNGNASVYGVQSNAHEIRRTLREGIIMPVDQMMVRLTTDDGVEQPAQVGLLAVGINDPAILCKIEQTRKNGKVGLTRKIIAGWNGVGEMIPTGIRIQNGGDTIYQHRTFVAETINGGDFVHVPVAKGTLNDGRMNLLAVRAETHAQGVARTLVGVTLAAMGIRRANPYLYQYQGDTFTLESEEPVAVHIDAEIQGLVRCVDIMCQKQGTLFLVPPEKANGATGQGV